MDNSCLDDQVYSAKSSGKIWEEDQRWLINILEIEILYGIHWNMQNVVYQLLHNIDNIAKGGLVLLRMLQHCLLGFDNVKGGTLWRVRITLLQLNQIPPTLHPNPFPVLACSPAESCQCMSYPGTVLWWSLGHVCQWVTSWHGCQWLYQCELSCASIHGHKLPYLCQD